MKPSRISQYEWGRLSGLLQGVAVFYLAYALGRPPYVRWPAWACGLIAAVAVALMVWVGWAKRERAR